MSEARAKIGKLINADSKDIIFTSGATESNNMAIRGVANFYGGSTKQKNHIITSNIEHKCILETCRYLEDQGFKITYLPVNK